MLSLLVWPKVIPLSGLYCNAKPHMGHQKRAKKSVYCFYFPIKCPMWINKINLEKLLLSFFALVQDQTLYRLFLLRRPTDNKSKFKQFFILENSARFTFLLNFDAEHVFSSAWFSLNELYLGLNTFLWNDVYETK